MVCLATVKVSNRSVGAKVGLFVGVFVGLIDGSLVGFLVGSGFGITVTTPPESMLFMQPLSQDVSQNMPTKRVPVQSGTKEQEVQ
mmetsp:Transcript_6231/g.11462  ORF Transcript_6231/g.11462 Transcript_6231/m.11462 type:complete len:85 (+) Transcript_6231:465-719(+)